MTRKTKMQGPFIIRDQARELINRELGIPMGKSTFDKICMPTGEGGPPIAGWHGKHALYRPKDVIEWAMARVQKQIQERKRRMKERVA